jgi:hypothetical protein
MILYINDTDKVSCEKQHVEEEPRKVWKWNSSRQFLLISRAKLGQQL